MWQNLQTAEHFTKLDSAYSVHLGPPSTYSIFRLINPRVFPLKEPSSGLIYDPISRFSPGHASARDV